MILFYMILIEYIIIINSLTVGKISFVSLNVPLWSLRLINGIILNGTCKQCLCLIRINSLIINGINIGSFNCFINNQTCQLFSNGSFYEYSLNNDTNTIYYFFNQPTIMNNSNLVAWHSFDGGSYNDSSGNGLNAIQVMNVLSVPGIINDAFYFYSNSSLYQISGFNSLGQSNNPYTISLWIQSKVIGEAPLVHLSSQINGQGWCIDMLSFLNNGKIVGRCWKLSPVIVNGSILQINVWNQIATIYSPSIGLQLYINGTLINESPSFSYSASGSSDFITLANSITAQSSTSCATNMIANTGTYQGLIDELRIYSRALSIDDIYALANP